jgi:hypothetical protein
MQLRTQLDEMQKTTAANLTPSSSSAQLSPEQQIKKLQEQLAKADKNVEFFKNIAMDQEVRDFFLLLCVPCIHVDRFLVGHGKQNGGTSRGSDDRDRRAEGKVWRVM